MSRRARAGVPRAGAAVPARQDSSSGNDRECKPALGLVRVHRGDAPKDRVGPRGEPRQTNNQLTGIARRGVWLTGIDPNIMRVAQFYGAEQRLNRFAEGESQLRWRAGYCAAALWTGALEVGVAEGGRGGNKCDHHDEPGPEHAPAPP